MFLSVDGLSGVDGEVFVFSEFACCKKARTLAAPREGDRFDAKAYVNRAVREGSLDGGEVRRYGGW